MAPIHVLVVDDEPAAARELVNALAARGWHVSFARSGQTAFHRAQALALDVILLDVYMPEMDGFATCRLLKGSPRSRDVPVLFLTSAASAEERLEGFRCGGVDYIIKPGLSAEVIARIRVHVANRPDTAVREPAESMPLLSDSEVLVRAATRWIRVHLTPLPTLAEIANAVGTYEKKLSRAFREHLGVTVFEWIREQRFQIACKSLTESQMSIGDIAELTGYLGAANFTTAFRERFGVTPSQYRANARDGRTP